jgi:hypothetical protein
MANMFSQMFTPTGPPRQRMDQGGGEYTGYIEDVYEGDDSSPMFRVPQLGTPTPLLNSPISNTGDGDTFAADQEAIRRRLLARMAESKTQPGYGAGGAIMAPEVKDPQLPTDTIVTDTVTAGPTSITDTVVEATSGNPREKKTLEGLFSDSKELFDKGAGFLGDEQMWTDVYSSPEFGLAKGFGQVAGNIGSDAADWLGKFNLTPFEDEEDLAPAYSWMGENPGIAAGGAAALGGAGIANRMLKARAVIPGSNLDTPDPKPTVNADKGPSRTSKVRTAINTGGNNLFRQLSGRGSPELETKIRETKLAAKNTGSVLAKPGLDNKVARLVAERPAIAKTARAAVTSPRAWKAYGVLALLGAAVGDAKAEEIYNAAMQPGSVSANAINTAGMILEGIPGLAYAPDSPFDKGVDPFAASVGSGGKRKGEGISDIGWAVPKPWEAQPY